MLESNRQQTYTVHAMFRHGNRPAEAFYLRLVNPRPKPHVFAVQWIPAIEVTSGKTAEIARLNIDTATKWIRFLVRNTSAYSLTLTAEQKEADAR